MLIDLGAIALLHRLFFGEIYQSESSVKTTISGNVERELSPSFDLLDACRR